MIVMHLLPEDVHPLLKNLTKKKKHGISILVIDITISHRGKFY